MLPPLSVAQFVPTVAYPPRIPPVTFPIVLVETLPEKARMVVLLRYQEDLDPVEIADLLDEGFRRQRTEIARMA